MKSLLSYLAIILFLASCHKQEDTMYVGTPSNVIGIGHADSIYSDVLNESRVIWVHVPESIKDSTSISTKYPVLYLLDGPAHFYSVTGMIKQLSSSNGNTVVPEMIVVGIANTNRSRDLTPTHVYLDYFSGDSIKYESGGGDKFLDFIEVELIPYVEKMYPANNVRTFVGHSFGGLSVINALINRSHLFENYVAIDPSLWWDDQALLKTAESSLLINQLSGKALYVGVANTLSA